MPIEYLAPGVFVEEIDAAPKPIEGVSTSTATFTGVYAHRIAVPALTPGWSNFNPSDPGVTLVQLFAFLAESLLYRGGRPPRAGQVNIAVFVSTEELDGGRMATAFDALCRAARGDVVMPHERDSTSSRRSVRRKKDP